MKYSCLEKLGPALCLEMGLPGAGTAIWRAGERGIMWTKPVGDFLVAPENQSGEWRIDGGWGCPPGPIVVKWNGIGWRLYTLVSRRITNHFDRPMLARQSGDRRVMP